MRILSHLQYRFIDSPLAIHPDKFGVIIAAVGPRVGVELTAEQIRELGLQASSWSEPTDRKSYSVTEEGIACVPVQGTLMKKSSGLMAMSGCSSYEKLAKQLNQCLADAEVKGILLDVDSPGGETHGMFDLCNLIYSMRSEKPIYAVANDAAMSAAYAIASCAERVYVTQTGGVGSVGVFALHVDQSGADENAGLKYSYIKAGKRKTDGNPHEPLSKSARNDTQAEVDREYGMFVETVARNRGVSADDIYGTEAGVYFARNAVPLLADKVGTFEDALAAIASKVTGIPDPKSKGKIMSKNAKKTRVASLLATLLATDDEEKIDPEQDDEERNGPRTCRSCGRFAEQGDSYCSHCGGKIDDGDEDSSARRSGSSGRAVTALHAMEQRVQQIVAASGGRLTKPQAYAQLLATPEGQQLYTRYDRERENASLTRDGREQYARAMHALMQSTGYGTQSSGIVDNLPPR